MSTFDKTGHQHLSAERLSEYIDGRLPLHEREGVEAQLRACAHCREEADSLRATVMLLRGVPAVPAPRSFALREAPSPRGGLFSLLGGLRLATAVAAGLLVLVLAGDILRLLPFLSVSPTPGAPVAALAVPAAPAEPPAPQASREAVRGPSPTAPAQKDQAISLTAAPVAPAATPAVGTPAPSPAPAATVAPAPAPMRAAAAPSGAAPALSPTPA
ncbi:MAG: zf-HC2 domain-containing protein, partial [Chloroflexota bacterium]